MDRRVIAVLLAGTLRPPPLTVCTRSAIMRIAVDPQAGQWRSVLRRGAEARIPARRERLAVRGAGAARRLGCHRQRSEAESSVFLYESQVILRR